MKLFATQSIFTRVLTFQMCQSRHPQYAVNSQPVWYQGEERQAGPGQGETRLRVQGRLGLVSDYQRTYKLLFVEVSGPFNRDVLNELRDTSGPLLYPVKLSKKKGMYGCVV